MGAIKELSKCLCTTDIHKTDFRDLISSEKGFFFSIKTPSKTYFLKAKSEDERNNWVEMLQKMGCPTQGTIPSKKFPGNTNTNTTESTDYQKIPSQISQKKTENGDTPPLSSSPSSTSLENKPSSAYQEIPRMPASLKKSSSSTQVTFEKISETKSTDKPLVSRTLSTLQQDHTLKNGPSNYQEIPVFNNTKPGPPRVPSFLGSTYPPLSSFSSPTTPPPGGDYQQIPKLPPKGPSPSGTSPQSPPLSPSSSFIKNPNDHYQQIPSPPSSKQ